MPSAKIVSPPPPGRSTPAPARPTRSALRWRWAAVVPGHRSPVAAPAPESPGLDAGGPGAPAVWPGGRARPLRSAGCQSPGPSWRPLGAPGCHPGGHRRPGAPGSGSRPRCCAGTDRSRADAPTPGGTVRQRGAYRPGRARGRREGQPSCRPAYSPPSRCCFRECLDNIPQPLFDSVQERPLINRAQAWKKHSVGRLRTCSSGSLSTQLQKGRNLAAHQGRFHVLFDQGCGPLKVVCSQGVVDGRSHQSLPARARRWRGVQRRHEVGRRLAAGACATGRRRGGGSDTSAARRPGAR